SLDAVDAAPRTVVESTEPLQLIDFTIKGEVENVHLTVHPGEIVGLAGLEGSGVLPILDVLFDRRKAHSGKVVLGKGRKTPHSIPAAVRSGVAYIPGDRRNEGLMMEQSIHANLSHVLAGGLGEG